MSQTNDDQNAPYIPTSYSTLHTRPVDDLSKEQSIREWIHTKPISILSLPSTDRLVLKIAGEN
jgi:hypothetical protein